MGPLDDAVAHLSKASEFLESARANQLADRFSAATSDAVIAGINAKDAICLKLTGATGKSDNHAGAVKELRLAGKAGADVAAKLSRLLSKKTQSQYQTKAMAKSDADAAVRHADALVEQAKEVVAT